MRISAAAAAAASVSKRSPSSTTMCGARRSKVSARPESPLPVDRAMPAARSLDKCMGTSASTANPSARIKSTVCPNACSRCIAVATICNVRSGASLMARISQYSRPYSARVPVTTQMRRVIAFDRHCAKIAPTRRMVRMASSSSTAPSPPPRTAPATRCACSRKPGLKSPSQACGLTGLRLRSPAF